MSRYKKLPRSCERMLSACSRRAKLQAALKGIFFFLSLVLGVFLVEFLLDYQLDLPVPVRGVLLAGICAVVLRGLYLWLMKPFARSPGRVELARFVEEKHPAFMGRLVTAVQMSRSGNPASQHVSPALIHIVTDEAGEVSRDVALERLFPLKAVLLSAASFLCLCLVWAGVFFWKGDVFGVWFSRLSMADQPWPRETHLVMHKPGDKAVVLARGNDLMVEVKVRKGMPGEVDLVCEWSGGPVSEKVMTRWGDTVYRHTLTNVMQPLSFYARGGDGRTARVSVALFRRPHVESMSVEVVFPPYTGMGRKQSSDGNIKALDGSMVSFTAAVTPPVAEGELALFESGEKEPFQGPKALEVALDGERNLSLVTGGFEVSRSGYYTLNFTSGDAFQSRAPSRYRIRAVPDRIPEIIITSPPPKEECTRDASFPLLGKVSDDWGVREVVFSSRVRFDPEKEEEYGPEKERSLFSGDPEKEIRVDEIVSLSDFTLQEGSTVLWRLKAVDAAGGTGVSSKHLVVVVRPADLKKILFDELGMVREDIRSLSDLQARARRRIRKLIDATAGDAELDASAASVLGRVRSEQQAVSRRLSKAGEKLYRIRDRMLNNMVCDLKDRRWVGVLGEEVTGMVSGLASPLVDSLGDTIEKQSNSAVSPDVLPGFVLTQEEIEKQLLDLVDRMMQFGDVNLLIRRLQNILYHEKKVRKMTKELMHEK